MDLDPGKNAAFEGCFAALVHNRRTVDFSSLANVYRAAVVHGGVTGDAAGVDRKVAAIHEGADRFRLAFREEKIAACIDDRAVCGSAALHVDFAPVIDDRVVDDTAFGDEDVGILVDRGVVCDAAAEDEQYDGKMIRCSTLLEVITG